MVSRTQHATILKIHNNDGEYANDPLETPARPNDQKDETQSCCQGSNATQSWKCLEIAELGPVVDAAIKQQNKSISEEEWLVFASYPQALICADKKQMLHSRA